MSLNFEKYAAKGNELVNMLAGDLQVPRDKAGRILRAVLHGLRNRLNIDESFELLSQLPMALKAVYVDGWKPSRKFKRIQHLSEFLDEIRKEDRNQAGYDFGNNTKATEAVKAVFRTLSYFISDGETHDMAEMMPGEIKKLIKETLDSRRIVV
jgi:uncharacterized protein (DUF2267 family)